MTGAPARSASWPPWIAWTVVMARGCYTVARSGMAADGGVRRWETAGTRPDPARPEAP